MKNTLLRDRMYVFYINRFTKDFQVIGPLNDSFDVVRGLLSSLDYPGTYDTDAADVQVGVCFAFQLGDCSQNPQRFLLPHVEFSRARLGGFVEVLEQLRSLQLAYYASYPSKELLELLTKTEIFEKPTSAYVVEYPDHSRQTSTILVCRGRGARKVLYNAHFWASFKMEFPDWLQWAHHEGAVDLTLCPSFPSKRHLAKWLYKVLEKKLTAPHLLRVCRSLLD
ncbi:hypothetical protein DRO59_02275 [Candidatus Bathyarchaeota archaeon]|nr:MAG: hypothetical protein DRO59_02275 [Candidatus Bathyarchaeota archaeon]